MMVKLLSAFRKMSFFLMVSFFISVSMIMPCSAGQKAGEYVNLSSLQLPGKVSENTNATINFKSTRPLKDDKLFMEVTFYNESKMELGGMFYYYPTLPASMDKTDEAVEDGFPKNCILFLISEDNKNEIKFLICYAFKTEVISRPELSNWNGKGIIDVTLFECVDDDCSDKKQISNVLSKDVEFE